MRDIIKKYLQEADNLEKTVADADGNIKDEFQGSIQNLLDDLYKRLFEEVKSSSNVFSAKYKDLLVKLDIFFYLLDEEGLTFVNENIKNINNNKWSTEAKNRLFMMYVKRLSEINYLLHGGYASAALSITRGIYEIAVYLEIILNNDEILAERFLKHCNTTRLKIAKSLTNKDMEYKITGQLCSFDYGTDYLCDYGWAKDIVKNRITFKKLAEKTKMNEFYYMYTYCCSSVHADIFDSLYGVDIGQLERGKSIWITESSEIGTDIVVGILTSFSYNIINKFLNRSTINTILIYMVLNDIINNNEIGY